MAKLVDIDGVSHLQLDNNDSVLIVTDAKDNKVTCSIVTQNVDGDIESPANLVVNCFHDMLVNKQELVRNLMNDLYSKVD